MNYVMAAYNNDSVCLILPYKLQFDSIGKSITAIYWQVIVLQAVALFLFNFLFLILALLTIETYVDFNQARCLTCQNLGGMRFTEVLGLHRQPFERFSHLW